MLIRLAHGNFAFLAIFCKNLSWFSELGEGGFGTEGSKGSEECGFECGLRRSPWTACSLLPLSPMQPAARGATQGFIGLLSSQCRRARSPPSLKLWRTSSLHCPELQQAVAVQGAAHTFPKPVSTVFFGLVPKHSSRAGSGCCVTRKMTT